MTDSTQLAAILDTVGEGVLTIDAEQRIRVVNREIERIFGYSREELIGRSVQILMPEIYRARHDAGFRRRLADPAGGDAAPIHRQFEGR